MNKKSTLKMSDDYPEITQKEIDRSVFRIGLKPAAKKRRVSIMLDSGVIDWFKKKAGIRGYQTLINNALKGVMEQDSLENFIRRIVHEELKVRTS